jgi:urease accessory protein UreF
LLPGRKHALIHVVRRTRNAKENQMKTTRMTVEARLNPQQRLEAIRQAQAEEGQALHNAARETAKAEKAKMNRLTCRTDAPAWYATQVGRTVELRRTGTDEVLATVHPPAAWGDDWDWNLIDGGVAVERTTR